MSTVLVQTEKSGKVTPVKITSARLSYTDSERKARFEGGVQAQGAELTITARSDGRLSAAAQPSHYESIAYRDGQDRPHSCRRTGSHHPAGSESAGRSVWFIPRADDKFVLTGGSPSIFDAEHGKITGVSLTLFRHDGRVVVEGNNTSPTVTRREWHVKCVPWPQTKSANLTVVDGW